MILCAKNLPKKIIFNQFIIKIISFTVIFIIITNKLVIYGTYRKSAGKD